MKALAATILVLLSALASYSQDHAKLIYDTERAFERAVADKGIKDGFIEFLSPVGVIFRPGPVVGRAWLSSQPKSTAALTWNPIRIEASANGALAYSIGNSIYKPKGSTDTEESYGHYLSIWTRQSGGNYLAALDAGINHPKPPSPEPEWKPGSSAAPEENERQLVASDSSVGFYRMAENRGLEKAYKTFAADDIFMMRAGKLPMVGRDAAVRYVDDQKLTVKFAKRRSFVEAGDLAFVQSLYTLLDKEGAEKEKGSFVQVWKLRAGKWLIAADIFIALPSS